MQAKTLLLFFTVYLFAVQCGVFGGRPLHRIKKNQNTDPTQGSGVTEELELCEHQMPCGWAIYAKGTRDLDYFMKNRCKCDVTDNCVRVEDDISQYAFVYRCRPKHRQRPKPTTSPTSSVNNS